MTTNSQLPTIEPKKQRQNKNQLSKQVEQEQNHTNGYHKEGYRRGGEWGKSRGKVQGIRSIIGRYKIDRGRLRTVSVSYTHLTLPTIRA